MLQWRLVGERMKVEVDSSQWPIVHLTFPVEVTFADVEQLAESVRTIFRARGPVALVADIEALRVRTVTPMLRSFIAEEVDKLAVQGAIVAEAVVVSHPLLRGLHLAYTWARRSCDYPARTFTTIQEATQWASQLVAGPAAHR